MERGGCESVPVRAVTGNEPDLQIYLPDFLPSRTTYRYVHATGSGGCEVEEGSVGGTGWRRLLQFATSDENVGNRALTIGGVDYSLSGHAGELDLHNLFELSPCHQHYHFKYYGDLGWAGAARSRTPSWASASSRQTASPIARPARCTTSSRAATSRASRRDGSTSTRLASRTSGSIPPTSRRARHTILPLNPNGFLCEGTFVDENGVPLGPNDPVVWAPTGLIAENGEPVEAPLCGMSATWDDNNTDSTQERSRRTDSG